MLICISSAGRHILQGTKRLFTTEWGDPLQRMSKGKANSAKFIMGSDATEFVNKVRNQVRIRQKRMRAVFGVQLRKLDVGHRLKDRFLTTIIISNSWK